MQTPAPFLIREPALVQQGLETSFNLTNGHNLKGKADEFYPSLTKHKFKVVLKVIMYLLPLHTLQTSVPAQEVTNPKESFQLAIIISLPKLPASSDCYHSAVLEHFLIGFSENELD